MIITIGREFGSGGRELGKRLADELGIPCYDKEIITEVANIQGISDDHVEHITQSDIRRVYTGTIGRTLATPIYYTDSAIQVFASQHKVIRRLAEQGDCVVVGRCADYILQDMKPLNIFVYADKASKIARCRSRSTVEESDRELARQMQRIDRNRASNYKLLTGHAWGKKDGYHLCINTSGVEIKQLVPALREYVKAWFERE